MAEIDEKSKQMVLRHMNADHRLDLGLYLRYINGLSAAQLAAEGEPEMLDMDLSTIWIRTATSGTVHTVALTPPMASWGERRTRLVAMALEARTQFGVPLPEHGETAAAAGPAPTPAKPVPFQPPAGLDVLVLGGVVLYAIQAVLVFSGHDATSAAVWSHALSAVGIPPPVAGHASWLSATFGGASGFRRVVHLLLLPVLLIHVTEAWWMNRTRLAPRHMRPSSRDWQLWMWTTAWEGVGAFRRFDRTARALANK